MDLEDLSGRSSESSHSSIGSSSSSSNCSASSVAAGLRATSCANEPTSDAENGNGSFGYDMPVALDKPKDYPERHAGGCNESSPDEPSAGLFRTSVCGNKILPGSQRESIHSFCKEIREMKQKSLHAVFERTSLAGRTEGRATATAAGVAQPKDLDFMKAYGLSFERVKDLGFASRINSIALDSLRTAPLTGAEPSAILDNGRELGKSLQSRLGLPAVAVHIDASLALERLRQAHHPLFQSSSGAAGLEQPATAPGHPYPQQQQQLPSNCGQQQQQQPVTQIAQMQHQQQQQHSSSQQIANHQHQQPKSFTIDAILGLRHATSHKDKQQRQHPYRRHQGQDCSTKNLATSSCMNNNNSNNNNNNNSNNNNGGNSNGGGSSAVGKLKRVRTIFTTEQLERLENEFARQQYMVGPERLYLAHALRLTEAQVKVWFQNRRIKWRKVNHEKQSQRLYELHQNNASASDRDDSSENIVEW